MCFLLFLDGEFQIYCAEVLRKHNSFRMKCAAIGNAVLAGSYFLNEGFGDLPVNPIRDDH
jgi:hypothetical protein